MAWSRPGDKPLFEPMMVSLQTHICVTRPQWINTLRPRQNGPRFTDTVQTIFLYESFCVVMQISLSGVPDYFGRNKISSGGDLSHYSSASLY